MAWLSFPGQVYDGERWFLVENKSRKEGAINVSGLLTQTMRRFISFEYILSEILTMYHYGENVHARPAHFIVHGNTGQPRSATRILPILRFNYRYSAQL